MSERYDKLREQAQIYEKMTGKKCNIYHQSICVPSIQYKPLKEKRHAYTHSNEEHHQLFQSPNQPRKNRFNIKTFTQAKNCRDKNQIFSNLLKKGMKMGFGESSKTPVLRIRKQSKNRNNEIFTLINPNPQKDSISNSLTKIYASQISKKSLINIPTNQKTEKSLNYNTISNNSITFKQQNLIINLKRVKQSKSNIIKNNQQTKQKAVTKKSFEKMKKQKANYELNNRIQKKLQQQIQQLHLNNKSYIEEILSKYGLKFNRKKIVYGRSDNHLKSSQKLKNSQKLQVTLRLQGLLYQQGIRSDEICQQIDQLNRQYKKNQKIFFSVEQSIRNNQLQRFLNFPTQEKIQQTTCIEEDNPEQQQQSSQNLNLIQKLQKSLAKLREQRQNNNKIQAQQPLINQRLKDILFN